MEDRFYYEMNVHKTYEVMDSETRSLVCICHAEFRAVEVTHALNLNDRYTKGYLI